MCPNVVCPQNDSEKLICEVYWTSYRNIFLPSGFLLQLTSCAPLKKITHELCLSKTNNNYITYNLNTQDSSIVFHSHNQ